MIRQHVRASFGAASAIEDKGYGTLKAFVDALGSAMTSSGVTMTPERALQISTVYSCISIVTETLATLPLILYRRRPDGGKDRAIDHPLFRLLRTRPSALHTASEFRGLLQSDVELHGNGYALRVMVGGQLEELLWIPAEMVRPMASDWSAEPVYRVRVGRSARDFPASEIFHVRGPFGRAFQAQAPCETFRDLFGLAWALEAYIAWSFRRGAKVSGTLEAPNKLSPAARKNLEDFLANYEGAEASKTMLLEEGLKYSKIAQTHDEAQVVAITERVDAKIARVHRVPLHMLAVFESQPRANMEQYGQEFVALSLRSRAVRLEERVQHSLLPPTDEYFVEHLFDALERGDLASRMTAYTQGLSAGIYNANEVRARENLNPYAGGETFRAPLNMGVAGTAALATARRTSMDAAAAVEAAMRRLHELVRPTA